MNALAMERLRTLATGVENRDDLYRFLRDGLGWTWIDPHEAEYNEPEIADGVPAENRPTVASLVPATLDSPPVFVVEFPQTYLRRDLRALLASLKARRKAEGTAERDTLFVVAQPEWTDVRFVYFRHRSSKLPEIRVFGWKRTEGPGRTDLDNLAILAEGLDGDWTRAFDVEALTEKFYRGFADCFSALRDSAAFPPELVGQEDAWTQALFNRLLFVAFVEKLSWLKLPDAPGNAGYLRTLYVRFKSRDFGDLAVADYPNTFLGVLQLLFHKAIDAQGGCAEGSRYHPLLGTVPYLNGGLFTHVDELDGHAVDLPDDAFDGLLGDDGLFVTTNFTVTESTPLDQNVEVDPEMLGKVFERLVNDRHAEGKYYTPRAIVDFMVGEALKGYLVERGVDAAKAALLVDDEALRNAAGTHLDAEDLEPLERHLASVRAVDPACGSGAYLLGLLQKLTRLVDVLRLKQGTARDLYEIKLGLLGGYVNQEKKRELKDRYVPYIGSIYGVDKDETAVRIARLRLWLSLAVDNRGAIPDPLPNLDFRIMAGDSLAMPVGGSGQTSATTDLARQYAEAKNRFFHPPAGADRKALEADANELRDAIKSYVDIGGRGFGKKEKDEKDDRFDWEVEFAEVWAASPEAAIVGDGPPSSATVRERGPGFDIVLANPPYVNSGQLLQAVGDAYKKELVRAYPRAGSGTADLLVYFFERAHQLLRPGGRIAFVTSNKWLKAGYGKGLRRLMAEGFALDHLLDYGDNEVFRGVIAYPLIVGGRKLAPKERPDVSPRYRAVPKERDRERIPGPAEALCGGADLPPEALDGTTGDWRLETGLAAGRLARMRERGRPLGEVVAGRIYYGIKTGLNEVKIGSDGRMYGKVVPDGVRVVRKEGVFVIDGAKRAELIAADPRSAEIIRPLAVGKDVKRWRVDRKDRWLVFTRKGVRIEDYPAILAHLEQFRSRLEPKPRDWPENLPWEGRKAGSYRWYEIQDDIAYYEEFEKPNLCCPDIATEPRFANSPDPLYFGNTAYIFTCENELQRLYLLGVLNSRSAAEHYDSLSPRIMQGYLRFIDQYLREMLVPDATPKEREAVAANVRAILARKATDPTADVSDLEKINDDLVERLYGLGEANG